MKLDHGKTKDLADMAAAAAAVVVATVVAMEAIAGKYLGLKFTSFIFP